MRVIHRESMRVHREEELCKFPQKIQLLIYLFRKYYISEDV